MAKPLPITQRQAKALLRAAEDERAVVEVVKPDGTTFRLIPASLAQDTRPIDLTRDEDLDAELLAFEAKHGHG